MQLEIPCKTGKLQITDDNFLQVQQFKKILWKVECSVVTGFSTQPGAMATVNITISTTQGQQIADMVTKANYEKLLAFFPHLQAEQGGKEWYFDPRATTHIEEYTNLKKMQREVEAASRNGWTLQQQSGVPGKVSVAKIIAGDLLFGPVGALMGAGRSKDKTTLTFVRTPEWIAAH